MVEVNHNDLKWAIERCRNEQVSLYVAGPSGIGKSESVWTTEIAKAKELSREFRSWDSFTIEEKEKLATEEEYVALFYIGADLRGSTMQETDLGGLPDFTKNKEFVEFKPRLLGKVFSMKRVAGFLFFDEINQAPKGVQNGLFKTIQDRSIGDCKVNQSILIIGAGNRIEDRASITNMSGPLATRFMQFELLCPSADEYIEYNLNSPYPNPSITGFLKSYSDHVYQFNPSGKELAFPNPRSIQRLAKFMSAMPMATEADIKKVEIIAKASCGVPWGNKFVAYARMARKVDVDSILNHPEDIKKHVGQLDLKYSIISAIAYKCRDKFKDTIEPALMVMNELDEESGVFGLRVIKQFVGDTKLKGHLRKSVAWDKHLSVRFGPFLKFDDTEQV